MRAVLFIPYGSLHPDKQQQLVIGYITRRGYTAEALCHHPEDVAAIIGSGRADVVVVAVDCAALAETLAAASWRIESARPREPGRRWTVQTLLARLYRSGMNEQEIAKRLDSPTGDITEHLRRAGLHPPRRIDPRK